MKGTFKKTVQHPFIDNGHLDCLWYGGGVWTAEDDRYVVSCEARGDVVAALVDSSGVAIAEVTDRSNGGGFYAEMRQHIKSDEELERVRRGDDPERALVLESGNWLEYFVFDKEADEWLSATLLEEGTDNMRECFDGFDEAQFDDVIGRTADDPEYAPYSAGMERED